MHCLSFSHFVSIFLCTFFLSMWLIPKTSGHRRQFHPQHDGDSIDHRWMSRCLPSRFGRFWRIVPHRGCLRPERHVSNRIAFAAFEHAIPHLKGRCNLRIGRPRGLSVGSDATEWIRDRHNFHVSGIVFWISRGKCLDHGRKRWLSTRVLCAILLSWH